MTDLLRLIETVSPDDAKGLDEIDARVHFLSDAENCGGDRFSRYSEGVTYYFSRYNGEEFPLSRGWVPCKYTRSRDALKSIRPKGWRFRIEQETQVGDSWLATMNKADGTHRRHIAKTETLAELHAILQSILYERSNGK